MSSIPTNGYPVLISTEKDSGKSSDNSGDSGKLRIFNCIFAAHKTETHSAQLRVWSCVIRLHVRNSTSRAFTVCFIGQSTRLWGFLKQPLPLKLIHGAQFNFLQQKGKVCNIGKRMFVKVYILPIRIHWIYVHCKGYPGTNKRSKSIMALMLKVDYILNNILCSWSLIIISQGIYLHTVYY